MLTGQNNELEANDEIYAISADGQFVIASIKERVSIYSTSVEVKAYESESIWKRSNKVKAAAAIHPIMPWDEWICHVSFSPAGSPIGAGKKGASVLVWDDLDTMSASFEIVIFTSSMPVHSESIIG